MKKLLFLSLLIFMSIISINAQNTSTYRGLIIDIDSKDPISNANIYLKNYNTGTCTNSNGEYSLKVKNIVTDTLIISHLNYKTKKIPFSLFNSPMTIHLRKAIFTLPEVNIADDDFVKSIVKNAYLNIKNNFRNQEAIIGANYYEHINETKYDSTNVRSLIADVFIEDPGYKKSDFSFLSIQENIYIQNIETTKDNLGITKVPASKTTNRLKNLIRNNPIRYKTDFWNTENNKYNYKLKNIIKNDSNKYNVFVIDFETKPEVIDYLRGTLFISQNKYCVEKIIMIDFEETTKKGLFIEKINDSTYSQIGLNGKYTILFRSTTYGQDVAYVEMEVPGIKEMCNNKTTYFYFEKLRLEYNEFYSGEELRNIDIDKMKLKKDVYRQ